MYKQKCYSGSEPRIEVTDEFIKRNNLCINNGAAKRIMNDDEDAFGFGTEVAIDFMSFEDAREYLKEDYAKAVESGEKSWDIITDVKEATQDFLDYMVFAWSKAMDERGLSAGRSIVKLSAWMDILGRPDVAEVLNDDCLYAPYGRPAMREACEMLGISVPDYL